MMEKLLFCFCIALLTVAGATAQGRTVTNLDLEKYRLERIKAETDLRENYAKLGFSSPEERARRDAESAKAAEALSAKLRAERLERERLDAQREEAAGRFAAYYRSTLVETVRQDYSPGYYWSYGSILPRPVVRGWYQTGYYAGGQFWPTGPRTRPQPLWVKPRR